MVIKCCRSDCIFSSEMFCQTLHNILSIKLLYPKLPKKSYEIFHHLVGDVCYINSVSCNQFSDKRVNPVSFWIAHFITRGFHPHSYVLCGTRALLLVVQRACILSHAIYMDKAIKQIYFYLHHILMCYETNNTWKVFVNGKVDATLNEFFFC